MFVTAREKSLRDRHPRWQAELGLNLDWTSEGKNGRKSDGMIYKINLLFKLIYARNVGWRKSCFLSLQVNSDFYLNVHV